MKLLFKILCAPVLLAGLAVVSSAADETWTGQISDSMCGASHASMTASHAGMTDRDCTLACINSGSEFVGES